MSTSTRLQHEEQFDRHLIGLVGGGCLGGAAASLLELVVGRQSEALAALGFAAVVGLVVNQLDPRTDTALVRLMLAVIGGIAMGAIAAMPLIGAPLWGAGAAGAFLGAAVTVGWDQSAHRRYASLAACALMFAGGVYATGALLDTGLLAPLEETFFGRPFAGAVWGLFVAVGVGIGDLKFERDSRLGLLDEAIERHHALVADYLESARDLYRQVVRECDRSEADDTRRRARDIAAESVDALIGLAEHFRELRQGVDSVTGARVERRLERIERRLDETTDPGVVVELERARAEAREQLEVRRRIEIGSARLESRLQRGVTTLEKLHLTLVQHATNSGGRGSLDESLGRLERLVDEVQLKSLSVEELCAVGPDGNVEETDREAELDETARESEPEPAFEGSETTPDAPSEERHEHVVCEQDVSRRDSHALDGE